ncbi:MAG TPA: hypothetical protein VK699_03505 [Terriglobales bacterium]|jgi:hypothetical protein|nr:hypothetical protein [Terriglobales bacterium]
MLVDEQLTMTDVDPLLLPFLHSTSPLKTEQLLSKLICEHADPIITSILRKKMHASLKPFEGSTENQDGLEIAGDVRALLISELRGLKATPGRRTIGDFPGYVAIKTYSACVDYLRKKHPQRWRLKNMLRYHLKRSKQFALWSAEGQHWLCGLRAWSEEKAAFSSPDRLLQLVEDTRASLANSISPPGIGDQSPADLFSAVFEKAGGPLELNELVAIAAEIWNIKDQPLEHYDETMRTVENLPAPQIGVDVAVGERIYLEKLWIEVCGLPALQRIALLLNLRDAQGDSVIAFIPYLGIASESEIAELVAMPCEQLAELWNDLPLDDASIAQLLGITRQQVINLRKTARERLARRMQALENNPRQSTVGR